MNGMIDILGVCFKPGFWGFSYSPQVSRNKRWGSVTGRRSVKERTEKMSNLQSVNWFRIGIVCREEMKFYPPIAEKSNSESKWSYALDNEDVFGDDNFEGFMGLDVFHGLYCEVI